MTPPLSSNIRQQIHKCCDAFDAAWRAAVDQGGEPPVAADYMPTFDATAAEQLAFELRQVDIEYALRHPDVLPRSELSKRWRHAHETGQLEREIEHWRSVILGVATRSREEQQWQPGERITDRFLIISALGQGGMGRVYLAEDAELHDELVALKVLQRGNLEHLRREVALARKVTHLNVCRVHDLVIAGRQAFLSMQFVEGQSLDKLLQQAGQLTESRASRVVVQLCQGLQAAHNEGVLHRDLKPANILIDKHGDVRIADFGLACSTQDGHPADGGTMVYMSPEQLAGEAVSTASDIYSLGLVLFEIYTGRRLLAQAQRKSAIAERRELIVSEQPEFYRLSPQVRDTIVACLQLDPSDRPATVNDVFRMLNDLSAAGPDPRSNYWNRRIARICFTLVLVCLTVVASMADSITLIGVADPRDPVLLRETANRILRDRDYPAPADTGASFASRSSLPEVPIGRIWYCYRESPRLLVPNQFFPIDHWLWQSFTPGIVTLDNPAFVVPGMTSVILDDQGGLVRFQAVPGPMGSLPNTPFALAQWEKALPEECQRLTWQITNDPQQVPQLPIAYEKISVWTASDAKVSGQWTLVAAEHRGQLIYLECLPPAARAAPAAAFGIGTELYFSLLVLACLVGLYNIRRGACDHRSALKVGIAVFLVALMGHYLAAHHLWSINELDILEIGLAMSLYLGFVGWIAYVAIEPFVRRYLPEAFAGWNRLLAGQFSNRIVGRDVLIGTTLTCVSAAITALVFLLIQDFTRPIEGPNSGLVETRTAVGLLLVWFSFSTALSMLMLVSLVIARQFLPRLGACIACTLLWTIPFFIPNAQPFLLNFILSFVLTSLTVFVLDRYGYLPIVVSWLVRIIILGPITFESHRWYSHISACILLAIAGAALYGMWTSTKPPVQAKSWS